MRLPHTVLMMSALVLVSTAQAIPNTNKKSVSILKLLLV